MSLIHVPEFRDVDLAHGMRAQSGMVGLDTKRGRNPGISQGGSYHVLRACVIRQGRASPSTTTMHHPVGCMQAVAVGPAST